MIHASLFSGIGGPEIAAAMLGWQNAFHCEINDFGRKILEYWFPKSESYKDVKTTNFTKWRGRIDVLTGGFPCQPFSYAGQRRGADDDRYLWPEFKRVISEIRPTWVVGENVAGITTMVEQGKVTTMESQAVLFDESDRVYRYKYEQPFTIQRVCADLEALQYSVQPFIIPACAVGAPHRRDRVFIVARRVDVTDTRSGGQSASEQQGERERTEVQQQSGEQLQHRAGGYGTAQSSADTDNKRLEGYGRQELQSHQGWQAANEHTACSSGEDDSRWASTDTSCGRISGFSDNGEQCYKGHHRQYQSSGEQSRVGNQQRWVFDGGGETDYCGQRWANFPSVSPIHRGNDGIPFDVDCLTISWGKNDVKKRSKKLAKWRTESLKAYGNAIVPQVMYEIFRFIEQIEND